MSLSTFEVQTVVKSAIGHIGKAAGGGSDLDIARAIASKLGKTDPSDTFAILNHVRAARRLADAGDAIESGSTGTTAYDPRTIDRSYDGLGAGFYYRVAVVVFDPSTLTSYSRLVTIYSGPSMTRDELHDAALADVQSDPGRAGRYLDGFGVTAQTSVTIRVITAGRTP